MNIELLNRRHYSTRDIYYRAGYGLASKLLKFENGIIYLELEVRKKWNSNYNTAVSEIAQCWKNSNPELQTAKECHIYVIDSKRYPYKRTLMHLGVKPGYDMRKGINFS